MVGSPHASLRISASVGALLLLFIITAVAGILLLGKTGLFDGGVIAFVSECGYRTEDLFQLDVAHQTRMVLSSRYDRIYSLSYSPDGKWLVFEAAERGDQAINRRIYAIDLETRREYTLAPDYVTFNGTPLQWQPDGQSLKLRMVGEAGTGFGMANIVVNVANGEVIEAIPIAETFTMIDTGIGDRLSGRIIVPVLSVMATGSPNNLVDVDVSAGGDVVRSRLRGRVFDLYVQAASDGGVTQVTHDHCIERYPRWQP